MTKLLASMGLLGLCLVACNSTSTDPGTTPRGGDARFEILLENPKWYRTFDSSNTIIPTEGTLLFAWTFGDAMRHPDSFYVGIDTLWALPQDMLGDTANDWDLQICPDGFCAGGVRNNVFGVNSPAHFGGTGEYANTEFMTEHHFQFYPAINPATGYKYMGPDSGIFGGMLYVRSRSTGKADTVLGFGAWKLEWDTAFPPPVHPQGRLPRRADFKIVNGKVRYLPD